jgi:THO complex subunit 2
VRLLNATCRVSTKIVITRPGFYVTFWQLSTYDLAPPGSKYDEEGAALRTLSRSEDSKYIAADRSADRAKRLTAGTHRSKRDRYNIFVNTLAQEFKEQTVSREFTMKRLGREKQHWFAHCKFVPRSVCRSNTYLYLGPKGITLVASMIENCIQPRCLLSPMDADFCAQFIKVMHTQGTPGFPTLMAYDKVCSDTNLPPSSLICMPSFWETMSKSSFSRVVNTKPEIMVCPRQICDSGSSDLSP